MPAASRLGNGASIAPVVLATGITVRLNDVRSDQPHLVAQGRQRPAPVMRAAACFHGNDRAAMAGHRRHQPIAGNAAFLERAAVFVDNANLHHALRQIDTDGRRVVHGPSLLSHGDC